MTGYLKCLKIIKNFKTGYRDDYLTKTALICPQFKEKIRNIDLITDFY